VSNGRLVAGNFSSSPRRQALGQPDPPTGPARSADAVKQDKLVPGPAPANASKPLALRSAADAPPRLKLADSSVRPKNLAALRDRWNQQKQTRAREALDNRVIEGGRKHHARSPAMGQTQRSEASGQKPRQSTKGEAATPGPPKPRREVGSESDVPKMKAAAVRSGQGPQLASAAKSGSTDASRKMAASIQQALKGKAIARQPGVAAASAMRAVASTAKSVVQLVSQLRIVR
jgi:hypothetical protein